MKIIFYQKKDGQYLFNTDDKLFVMNNMVYADNGREVESEYEPVNFEDFIKPMYGIGWKVEDK